MRFNRWKFLTVVGAATLAGAGLVAALLFTKPNHQPPVDNQPRLPAPAAAQSVAPPHQAAPKPVTMEDPMAGTWYDASGQPWWARGGMVGQGKVPTAPQPKGPLSWYWGGEPEHAILGTGAGAPFSEGFKWTIYEPPVVCNWSCAIARHRIAVRDDKFLVVIVETGRFTCDGMGERYTSRTRFELTRDNDLLSRQPPPTPRSADELDKALANPDWAVRREAIRELGGAGGAATAQRLAAALKDPFFTNKRLAIRGLGRLKARETLPALVSCLESGHPELVGEAAHALVEFGPEVAPELMPYVGRVGKAVEPAWTSPLVEGEEPGKEKRCSDHARDYYLGKVFATWGPAALPVVNKALETGDWPMKEDLNQYYLPGMKSSAGQ